MPQVSHAVGDVECLFLRRVFCFLIFFSVYEATFVRRLGGGVAGVWLESHYTRSGQASCKQYEE